MVVHDLIGHGAGRLVGSGQLCGVVLVVVQQQRHLQAGRADALGIDDAVAAVLGHEVRQVRVHEMRVQVRQRVAAVVVVVTDVERRAFAGRAVEDRVERVHVLDAVFAASWFT